MIEDPLKNLDEEEKSNENTRKNGEEPELMEDVNPYYKF